MRTFGKWLGRTLLMLVLAAVAVGVWKREEIMRLMAVNTLFEADRIVSNFSNMSSAFLTLPVSRGTGPVVPLDTGPDMTLPAETADWITARTVTSLLVMKDGQIVHESYYQGTSPEDLRISWSIAKSYLSALVGILVAEGAIPDLDAPVTQYAPGLTGTAYDGASVRNVLQMSSGVVFDEDYLNYDSDINRMGRAIALGGKLDEFAASLSETFTAPGQQWQYVSIDTHVIGMVVRGATGRSVTDLLSEKIISRLGQDYDARYITDGAQVAFVLGGLNLTTRDYARFGQMIAQNGQWNGAQIVPADWIAESTAASAPTKAGRIGYGYQWWIPVGATGAEFMGRGIYGQYLYIDQDKGVVIVTTAADRRFRDDGVGASNVAMFRRITAALD